MTWRDLAALLLGSTLVGCGADTYIVLRITGSIPIPSALATMTVHFKDTPTAGSADAFASETFEFTADDEYPLRLLFEPSDSTPKELFWVVEGANSSGSPFDCAPLSATWRDGAINVSTFSIDNDGTTVCNAQ